MARPALGARPSACRLSLSLAMSHGHSSSDGLHDPGAGDAIVAGRPRDGACTPASHRPGRSTTGGETPLRGTGGGAQSADLGGSRFASVEVVLRVDHAERHRRGLRPVDAEGEAVLARRRGIASDGLIHRGRSTRQSSRSKLRARSIRVITVMSRMPGRVAAIAASSSNFRAVTVTSRFLRGSTCVLAPPVDRPDRGMSAHPRGRARVLSRSRRSSVRGLRTPLSCTNETGSVRRLPGRRRHRPGDVSSAMVPSAGRWVSD